MATDPTPPNNKLILTIAAASVFTLGTLKFVFDSYYHYVMEEEVAAKAASPVELRAARLEEQQRLSSGPTPIDKAMQAVSKGREELITPQQSADDGPLVGWSKSPRAYVPPAGNPTPDVAGDGGANMTGDAGAVALADGGKGPAVAADAGKPAAPGAPHAPPGPAPGAPHAPPGPAPGAPPHQ